MRNWRAILVSDLAGVAELNAMLSTGFILMERYALPGGVLFLMASPVDEELLCPQR